MGGISMLGEIQTGPQLEIIPSCTQLPRASSWCCLPTTKHKFMQVIISHGCGNILQSKTGQICRRAKPDASEKLCFVTVKFCLVVCDSVEEEPELGDDCCVSLG